jgi:hypothetical protein
MLVLTAVENRRILTVVHDSCLCSRHHPRRSRVGATQVLPLEELSVLSDGERRAPRACDPRNSAVRILPRFHCAANKVATSWTIPSLQSLSPAFAFVIDFYTLKRRHP